MNKIIYIIILFANTVSAQMVINYNYTDTDIQNTDNQSIKKYSLKIANNKSIFKTDSIAYISKSGEDITEVFINIKRYQNYKQDKWIQVKGDYKENWGYERKISNLLERKKFNWQQTGLEKEILGMRCIEVVFKNRKAYYTPKIPIPDGPGYGIFGLPGIVLEYVGEGGHWTAQKITTTDNIKIVEPEIETTNNESQITIPLSEVLLLPSDKAIITTSDTPINTWLRFK